VLDGLTCLVDSNNERDLNLLNSLAGSCRSPANYNHITTLLQCSRTRSQSYFDALELILQGYLVVHDPTLTLWNPFTIVSYRSQSYYKRSGARSRSCYNALELVHDPIRTHLNPTMTL